MGAVLLAPSYFLILKQGFINTNVFIITYNLNTLGGYKMKIEDIQKKENKKVSITIRTYPSYSKWFKKNNISPTTFFNKSAQELMEQVKADEK